MTVESLKRDKGHLIRVTFKDGKDILLDVDLCVEKCIHEGDELSGETVKEYLKESDYIRAKSRALWLLDRYTYSERRLCEKLKQAGFGEETAARVICRLKELSVIDDLALSSRFAEELARRGVSKREAYSKLYLKGFSADTVKAALEQTEFDEIRQIKELLEKKYKSKLLSGDTDKVYAALIRKGFSYSAVREALKQTVSELEFIGDM